jgi:hypothetical protein
VNCLQRSLLARCLEKSPLNGTLSSNSEEAKLLRRSADRKVYNIIHLIYRARNYEGHSKDYEFSRLSMEEHWRAGYHDARRTLSHPEILKRPTKLRKHHDRVDVSIASVNSTVACAGSNLAGVNAVSISRSACRVGPTSSRARGVGSMPEADRTSSGSSRSFRSRSSA